MKIIVGRGDAEQAFVFHESVLDARTSVFREALSWRRTQMKSDKKFHLSKAEIFQSQKPNNSGQKRAGLHISNEAAECGDEKQFIADEGEHPGRKASTARHMSSRQWSTEGPGKICPAFTIITTKNKMCSVSATRAHLYFRSTNTSYTQTRSQSAHRVLTKSKAQLRNPTSSSLPILLKHDAQVRMFVITSIGCCPIFTCSPTISKMLKPRAPPQKPSSQNALTNTCSDPQARIVCPQPPLSE